MVPGKRVLKIRETASVNNKTLFSLGELPTVENTGFLKRLLHINPFSNPTRPKQDLVNQMADVFDVSPQALTVPDIDSYIGLTHTSFALEDMYGMHIDTVSGELCLRLDKQRGQTYVTLFRMLNEWKEMLAKYESGEITKEEYDHWRYNYPKNSAKFVNEEKE